MLHELSEFGVKFQKAKLDNGIDVFSFYRTGMPLCLRVIFFAGSRFDTTPGTAHFLEHMLVAGTSKFPSKDRLAIPLERIGGSFSASTNSDYIRLNVTVPQREDLNIGIEILEEMLFHSLFEDKIIENEKNSIISEIGEAEEDPYYTLDSIYYPIVFKKTPLENNVMGSKDSVSKISKQDLLKFKGAYLRAGNIRIIASGGATVEEYLPLLDRCFINYKPEKHFAMPPKASVNREDYMKYKPFRDNKQVYAKIGFRTIGMNENDGELFSLDLIAGILGKGRASRLLKELRYKRGLVYGIGAKHSNYPDAGDFSVSTSFEYNKLNDVIETIINELKKIERDGISEDELGFAKSAITKSIFNNTQTSWSWINIHEDEMVFNPKLTRTVDYFMNEVNSLTLEEVNATAKKYLHKDNFYLALCGIDKHSFETLKNLW